MSDPWKGRRCLITGAGGFIGSALCVNLQSKGAVVHALHRRDLATRPRTLVCDVTDIDQVRVAFEAARPDFVFHLAGRVTGNQRIDLVQTTMSDILVGTVNVLLTAAETGCQRIVTIGSLMEPDRGTQQAACSPYAAAKFAASAYARMFAEVFSLPVAIAKLFMVYGPGQLDFTKLVPYVARQLLGDEVAELSSGQQAFDWIYVEDVVEGLLAVAASDAASGRTIDIGSGRMSTVADVAAALARRVGRADALKFGAITDRKKEPTRLADVGATEELIGWRPRVSLEEGLDRTVAWYRTYLARTALAGS